MPFTFLSHQAPVLPLKLWRPGWFDGTALAIGSMSPDFGYAFNGTVLAVDAHTLPAQLWFCLPVTLGLVWVVRRVVARPLAVHLPDAPPFRLRDYRRLAEVAHPLGITVSSALLGSLSHVGIDGFTHADGWAVARLEVLHHPLLTVAGVTVPVFKALQYLGHVLGGALAIWLLLLIGRGRRLTAWAPDGPAAPPGHRPTPASRRRLWGSVAIAGIAALLLVATTAGSGPAAIMRMAAVLFLGVLTGCLLARPHLVAVRSGRRPGPGARRRRSPGA